MHRRLAALLLLLPLLAACGGSDGRAASPTPTPSPTVSPTPVATVTARVFQNPVRFSTADGHIGCDLEPAFVECSVRGAAWKAPRKPSDCHNNWGTVLQFTVGTKGQFICWFGLHLQGAKRTLRSGQAFRVGLVTCTGIPRGVQCSDQQNGFLVTTKQYRLF